MMYGLKKMELLLLFSSQSYLHFILANPLLARHISVKKFLDPVHYSEDLQGNYYYYISTVAYSCPKYNIAKIKIHNPKILKNIKN